jgi:hypothetical protein
LTFFWIFIREWLDQILASVWSLDEMWTIYSAWTMFHTLAINRPILNTTNQQDPQLTDVTIN